MGRTAMQSTFSRSPAAWFGRYAATVSLSGACGVAVGAVAGSIYPLIGTIFGMFPGFLNGVLIGAVTGPWVMKRCLQRVFGVATGVAAVAAAVWVAIGYALFALSLGGTAAIPDFLAVSYAVGLYVVPTLAYVLAMRRVVRTRGTVWPRLKPGECAACGYDASGLEACPECGAATARTAKTVG